MASASNYELVNAQLRGVGRAVQVYVDRADDSSVSPALIDDIIQTFDDRIVAFFSRSIGEARDTDGDGRFTVFLSSRLSRLGGGRNAVDGFVRAADLDPLIPAPFSNHADMMYLNAALSPGPHLRTVMAHEYTHAVSFSIRGGRMSPSDEEGWLDEAIAHLVEDMRGFSRSNLDYRVSAFLSEPEKYRLVVDDYYAADLFRSHGNRGATYLFLRWCVDQYGEALIPRLIRSGRRGIDNLEAVTGRSFESLYRDWTIALYASGLTPREAWPREYRSITLRGVSRGWLLAGPRTTIVRPGDTPLTWNAPGTTSRYILVESIASEEIELEVNAPEAAELQVTQCTPPGDQASLELNVRVVAGRDRRPYLSAEVRGRDRSGIQLDAIAWEPLIPRPDPRSAPFRHECLVGSELAKAFGESRVPIEGSISTRRLASAEAIKSAPLVFKVLGTDSEGRRIAAFASVPGPEGSSTTSRSSRLALPVRAAITHP